MLSLADAILEEKIDEIISMLRFGVDVNQVDEYGFTPLIEASIVDNKNIAALLLNAGADANLQDMLGNTALHWAAENNNIHLCQLLLDHKANPNAYNLSGQPILTMPLLRHQTKLKKILIEKGAHLLFTQDYINAKLLGHIFELVGTANILSPNHDFVEVDFEGFYLEFSLALISESLMQFNSHFSARQLKRYDHFTKITLDALLRAAQLIKYQQYRTIIQKHQPIIHRLIEKEPLIIPIGYEGHAITFIKYGNKLVKCDRREASRLYDNIVFYLIKNPNAMNFDAIQTMLYEKQSYEFINIHLPTLLDLAPITELTIPAQISGNCSWANVEACIPSIFFLLFAQLDDFDKHNLRYKSISLDFFRQWQQWNKKRALQFCIKSFKDADYIRRACKAEILAAILFQCYEKINDSSDIEKIMSVFSQPTYRHVLENYIKSYYYGDSGEEGKNFLNWLKRNTTFSL